MSASDPDLPQSQSSLYYFIMGGDSQSKFTIDHGTGTITVNGKLDHESVSRYMLNISATDGVYTSFITVQIRVIDINDNSPVCNKSFFMATVLENEDSGSYILTMGATDADRGDNAALRYALFGDGVNKFAIDSRTGMCHVSFMLCNSS